MTYRATGEYWAGHYRLTDEGVFLLRLLVARGDAYGFGLDLSMTTTHAWRQHDLIEYSTEGPRGYRATSTAQAVLDAIDSGKLVKFYAGQWVASERDERLLEGAGARAALRALRP